MKFLLTLACLVFPFAVQAADGSDAVSTKAVKTNYRRTTDLIFTPPSWPVALKADLYMPEGIAPRPAVLVVYGGGWKAKDNRKQMRGISEKLAKRGYFVMNTSYRGSPEFRYPAAFEDLRVALTWMRAHAAEYNIQADRVAIYGFSAGGHLAELVGTMDGSPVERVQAVVAGSAPSDLRLFPGGDLVPAFLGGTLAEIPDTFRDASPVVHVTKDDPPFYLYHGTKDNLVPPEHAQLMKDALDRAGVRNELHWVKGRGHATAFIFDDNNEERAIDFLDRVLR